MFLDSLLGPFIALLSLFYLLRRLSFQRSGALGKSVAIIVLGDIGRSPRMLYHAQSFVDRGYNTHIVAYPGPSLIHLLARLELINLWGTLSRLDTPEGAARVSPGRVCVLAYAPSVRQWTSKTSVPTPLAFQSPSRRSGTSLDSPLSTGTCSCLHVRSGESQSQRRGVGTD